MFCISRSVVRGFWGERCSRECEADFPGFRYALERGVVKPAKTCFAALKRAWVLMKYTISRDADLVTVIACDAVTLQDCIRSVEYLLKEVPLQPGMQLLIDATCVKPELSFDELRQLAWHVNRVVRNGVRSIAITANGDFIYGLARVFSAYADMDGFNVSIFRTQETARTWLESCRPVTYSSLQIMSR